jgi:hypothetical protein
MIKRGLALIAVGAVVGISFFGLSSASANETVKFIYDARGRLIRVERSGTVNNNVKTAYSLDRAGNRTTVITTGK